MIRFIIVRPGATDFDEQKRIKGNLDIPLNEYGVDQIARTANELVAQNIEVVYSAVGLAAQESATVLAHALDVKTKTLPNLQDLDHGLWQGRLIEDVKATQPKVYKLWQDAPEKVCPPEGEMLDDARPRVCQAVDKLLRKHKEGVVAIVVSEPLASLVRARLLERDSVEGLWQVESACASWDVVDIYPAPIKSVETIPGVTIDSRVSSVQS